MIQSTLLKTLEQRIDYKKALVIFGPRQTGKTTLAKALASRLQQPVEYFNGDAAITISLWRVEGEEYQHLDNTIRAILPSVQIRDADGFEGAWRRVEGEHEREYQYLDNTIRAILPSVQIRDSDGFEGAWWGVESGNKRG